MLDKQFSFLSYYELFNSRNIMGALNPVDIATKLT